MAKFDGYEVADAIDKQLEKVLEQVPITPITAMEWYRLTRTIRTTLEIIEYKINKVLKTKC